MGYNAGARRDSCYVAKATSQSSNRRAIPLEGRWNSPLAGRVISGVLVEHQNFGLGDTRLCPHPVQERKLARLSGRIP
jgi:hypothetical protein